MNKIQAIISGCAVAAGVAGCASTPEDNAAIEQLRSEYDQLASQPYVQRHAAQRLSAAEKAVNEAVEVWESDRDEAAVEHHVYIAEKRLAIAEEAAKLGRAERMVENAEAERRQVLLEIREGQAKQAENRAQQAQLAAEMAQSRAEMAESRAQELEQSLTDLQGQVENLRAEKTEEGIVLTLDEILFNLNESELSPAAGETLDKVAQFLNRYEDRSLEIEGHTDSTGSSDYNQDLSERRAQSVKAALVERGVKSGRVRTEGYGSTDPVATNETSMGRQRNRRVEIIIEDPQSSESMSAR